MDTMSKPPADPTAAQLSGSRIIAAVKEAGIGHVLSVPDLHTAKGLLLPISTDPELRLIRVCKEDECFGIATGLSYGDKRALILIQYTGFFYAMNAIRAVAVEHKQPMCMMIGVLGNTPGQSPSDSKRPGHRVIEPMLDLWGIPHDLIDTDADVPRIAPAIRDAYENSHPTALLIGRRPV
ncbi:MAG TPA: decarboxylase [Alphaproteobacteria bacterium]|nr:decarboxylase [Alphaproteobacteria bacterium]